MTPSYSAYEAARILDLPYHKLLALVRQEGYGRYIPGVGWRISARMIAKIKGEPYECE